MTRFLLSCLCFLTLTLQVFSFDLTSSKDREEVETFLTFLMIDQQFAYTLHGSKPMSTTTIFKGLPNYQFSLNLGEPPLFKYWERWKDHFAKKL